MWNMAILDSDVTVVAFLTYLFFDGYDHGGSRFRSLPLLLHPDLTAVVRTLPHHGALGLTYRPHT